jgi:resolvase-like protein
MSRGCVGPSPPPRAAIYFRQLEPGDVLVVTRLDRLARSTRDLLNVLDEIGKRGAGFRSLKDAWADTTTPHGKLMVTMLGGLAEFERELIRARTGEGRKRAKERGVRFGPPAQDDAPSAPGSASAPSCGRYDGRCCADLCRRPGHHQPTGDCQPFRARRGRRSAMKR